jgi:hypothetical protein
MRAPEQQHWPPERVLDDCGVEHAPCTLHCRPPAQHPARHTETQRLKRGVHTILILQAYSASNRATGVVKQGTIDKVQEQRSGCKHGWTSGFNSNHSTVDNLPCGHINSTTIHCRFSMIAAATPQPQLQTWVPSAHLHSVLHHLELQLADSSQNGVRDVLVSAVQHLQQQQQRQEAVNVQISTLSTVVFSSAL